MEESAMKMFRGAVAKIVNAYQNKPLSEFQNNIIRDHFNRIFSAQQHTPDHPPYAWMIERALQELNEKGGSTEESISNFIRKEYDDLPWFHSTLLNHHLLELCKCGIVFVTHGQRYSLVNADSSSKPGKKDRKRHKRRKRGWDWQIKQRKLRYKKLVRKKDQVREKHNCTIQQNIEEAEMKKEFPVVIGDDRDEIEIEISTPEAPPGYDLRISKESSDLPPIGTEDSSWGTHPMGIASKIMAFLAEDLSGPQEQIQAFNDNDQPNYKEDQIILSEHEAAVTSVTKTSQPIQRTCEINLQCIMEKENPAMSSRKGCLEHHNQKVLPKSKLTENATASFESGPEFLGGGGGEQLARHVVFKYKRRRIAKEKNRREEQVEEERKLKCQGQKRLYGNAIASSFLQEQGFSCSNEREIVKFTSAAGKRSPEQLNCILALPAVEECASKRFNQHSETEITLQSSSNHLAKRRRGRRALQRSHSMPEQSEAIATDDFLLSSCHQHNVQKQIKYNLRSRSLKAKSWEGHE